MTRSGPPVQVTETVPKSAGTSPGRNALTRRLGGKEDAALREPAAAVHHVVDADHAWVRGGLDDVELRLVGRKSETVWPVHIARGDRQLACPGIPAVDVGWQLGLRHVPLVVAEHAERR